MSWEQLRAIEEEALQEEALLQARPLVDCPVCATLLVAGPSGRLACPWGDWEELS